MSPEARKQPNGITKVHSHMHLQFILVLFLSCLTLLSAQSSSHLSTLVSPTICPRATSISVDDQTGNVILLCFNGPALLVDMSHTPPGVTTLVNATVCPGPNAALRVNDTIFIACYFGSTIAVDTKNNTTRTIMTSKQCVSPNSFTLDPTQTSLIVSCTQSGIKKVDLQTLNNISTMITSPECTDPTFVIAAKPGSIHADPTLNPFSLDVIVACNAGHTIAIAPDLSVRTVFSAVQCENPTSVFFGSHTSLIYATCQSGGVKQLNVTTGEVIQLASFGECPGANSGVSVQTDRGPGVIAACVSGGIVSLARVSETQVAVATIAESSEVIHPSSLLVWLLPAAGQTELLVASYGAGLLAVSEQMITQLLPASECLGPHSSLPLDSTDSVLVSCYYTGIVSVHGSSRTSVVNASVCPGAEELVYDSHTGNLIAACLNLGVISIAPNGSVTVLLDWSQCKYTYQIALEQESGILLAICYSAGTHNNAGLIAIDLRDNNRQRNLLNHTDCPAANAVSYVQGYKGLAFVSCEYQVLVVDVVAGTNWALTTPGMCGLPYGAQYDPVLQRTYLVCNADGILVLSGPILLNNASGPISSQKWWVTTLDCPNPFSLTLRDDGSVYALCYSGSVLQLFAPNSYSVVVPASECLNPAQMTFSNDGNRAYVACSEGSFLVLTYQGVCPAGSYYNAATCTPCPLNTYHPFDQVAPFSYCAACQPGSISSIGASECTPCPPGTYADLTQVGSPCTPAPPGTAQPQPGSISVEVCGPGTFASYTGTVSCTPCTGGNSNTSAATFCACPDQTEYDASYGGCNTCPLGEFSSAGGACIKCADGSYTPTRGSGCQPCPGDGLQCVGGIIAVVSDWWPIVTLDGNAIDVLGGNVSRGTNITSDNGGSYSFTTVRCPVGACSRSQPATLGDASDPSSMRGLCAWPRMDSLENPLCGGCVAEYIAWGDNCVPCVAVNGGLVTGALLLLLLLALVLLLTSASTSGELNVVLFFVQTAVLELGPVDALLSWLQVANLRSNSFASCIAPWSAEEQMLMSMLVPFFLCVCLAVWFGLHAAVKALVQSKESNNEWENAHPKPLVIWGRALARSLSVRRYLIGAMAILQFSYTQSAISVFDFLYCVPVGTAKLLFYASTVDCESSAYKKYLALPIVMLLVYIVGLPLALAISGWRSRRRAEMQSLFLQQKKSHIEPVENRSGVGGSLAARSEYVTSAIAVAEEEAVAETESDSDAYPWSSVYRSSLWYWPALMLLRRVVFVALSIFLGSELNYLYMSYSLTNLALLLCHIWLRPFRDDALNRHETLGLASLAFFSILLTGAKPPYSTGFQIALFATVIPTAVILVVLLLRTRYATFMREREAKAVDFTSSPSSTDITNNNNINAADQQHDQLTKHGDDTPAASPNPMQNGADMNGGSMAENSSPIKKHRGSHEMQPDAVMSPPKEDDTPSTGRSIRPPSVELLPMNSERSDSSTVGL